MTAPLIIGEDCFLDAITLPDVLFDPERLCPACKGRCYDGKAPCETCWGEGYAPRCR
jgi:DnaJ-class molecular chaperone